MKISKSTRRIIALITAVVMCLSSTVLEVIASSNVTTMKGVDADSRKEVIKYINKKLGADSVLYHGLVPGLKQTVTKKNGSITTCSKMTPQGLTLAGNYIIISAYCNCSDKHDKAHNHNSVLYIIDKTKKNTGGSLDGQYEYKTTVILDTWCHVGGIAKAGSYLWVCDSDGKSQLRLYKWSDITKNINKAYHYVTSSTQRNVAGTPSFMCTAKNSDNSNKKIYVGTFRTKPTNSTSYKKYTEIYYYKRVGSKIKHPFTSKENKAFKITVEGIDQVQGISVRNGVMLLTASYGKSNKSYIYRFKYEEKKATYKKSEATVYTMPNMLEACYISPTRTYCLFESAAKAYLDYSKNIMPMDNYVAIDNNSLGFSIN